MKFSNDKRINALVKKLKRFGWNVQKGKKHYVIVSPHGKKHTIPSTPSDWRASRNFQADINRRKRKEA